MAIHAGFSEDGVHWNINEEKVEWINDDPETAEAKTPGSTATTPRDRMDRGQILDYMVQRIRLEAYNRCGLDKGLQGVPPVRERIPSL